ncbi:MBL fold metallo-hydrolase [candidate division KSB1 bacterium]
MKNYSVSVLLIISVLFFNISDNISLNHESQQQPVQLSDNLYRIDTGPVSSVILTGEDGTLIVDTSFDETGENIKTGLEKLGAGDIKYIINTHWHHDHCLGNIEFGKDAVIISHDNAKPLLTSPRRLEFFDEDYKALPKHALPNLTFSRKMKLHVNEEEIELIHFPNGHTNNDIIVYFKKANVLHIGDMIFSDMFPFIDVENGGNVEQLAENLREIIEILPDDILVIPGHGRNYSSGDLREYRNMLVSTYEIVKNEMEKGRSLEEMQEADILKEWVKWENGHHPCSNWIRTIHYCITKSRK